jgi:hypothetical protein
MKSPVLTGLHENKKIFPTFLLEGGKKWQRTGKKAEKGAFKTPP